MASHSSTGVSLILPPPSANAKRRHLRPTIRMSNKSNPITTLTKILWGPSLPPQLLISTARAAWSTVWHLMMSQLAPSDPTGGYNRPASQFRSPTIQPRPNLHLYVSLPCPWAHRTLIVRALKGLEGSIPVSIASPGADGSWEFRANSISAAKNDMLVPGSDKANGCKTLKEVYNLRRGGYSGRSTVPMLWDVDKKDVACNESYDIIELFNSGLNELSSNPGLDLAPPRLKKRIEEWNQIIYPTVNNGVYRCGFAQSQEAYDTAVNELFSTLNMVDEHLVSSRYLCGDTITLADVCLFTTLIRFDSVYNVLFKCTKRKLVEYPNLHGYLRDIYQTIGLNANYLIFGQEHQARLLEACRIWGEYVLIPKVAETCNLEAIMDGYYKILFPLNPGSIRPVIPSACEHDMLSQPHNRESSLIQEDVKVFSM